MKKFTAFAYNLAMPFECLGVVEAKNIKEARILFEQKINEMYDKEESYFNFFVAKIVGENPDLKELGLRRLHNYYWINNYGASHRLSFEEYREWFLNEELWKTERCGNHEISRKYSDKDGYLQGRFLSSY